MKSLVYLFWSVCFVVLTVPAFAHHGLAVRQRVVVRPVRQRVVVQRVVVPHVQQFVAPQAFYVPQQQFYAPAQQFNAGCHNGQQQFNAGGCQALYSR